MGMDTTLEQEPVRLEARLETAARSARSALAELKRARASAAVGQLRDLGRSLVEARNAARRFAEDVAGADGLWTFEAEPYFAHGGYLAELLAEAGRAGLNLFERRKGFDLHKSVR